MSTTSSLDVNSLFGAEGKRVLITGAGTGIGLMLAKGFAANGAIVYIIGRRAEKLEEAAKSWQGKGKLVPLPGDVSSKEGLSKIVADYSKTEDHLDVLITNAGISRDPPIKSHPDDVDKLYESLWSPPWEDFTETFDINIGSQYFTSVAFVPLLHKASLKAAEGAEKPSIINLSSVVGQTNQRDSLPTSYQVSKAATLHLTKVLATRLMPYHIRVNGIAPGLFPSELTIADPAQLATRFKVKEGIPEGRAGTAEDISGTALFLTGRGGAFVNGVTILADGGRALVVSGRLESK